MLIGEAWYTGNGTANSNIVEEFAEDGGYTKLREISLSYSMDNSAVRRMGFSSIDLCLNFRADRVGVFRWYRSVASSLYE